MTIKKKAFIILLNLFLISIIACGQSINIKHVKKLRLNMYPVEGLVWKGESAQNTNWNKITETPDGKVWFCGGDHWGTDAITGPFDKGENYERPSTMF